MEEKFGRWPILFSQYCKRDLKKIILWLVGLGLFSSALVPVFEDLAKGQGLIGLYEAFLNPVIIAMVGPTPIKSASNYTLGAMYAHEMLLFSSLFALVLSLFHVIGHTRKEEDHALAELIRSFPLGRQANSLAVFLENYLINILLAIFITLVLISFRTETINLEGSLIFALSVASAGIMGGGLGLLVAQIMPRASMARGASLGLVAFLYILRGGTDIINVNLSFFNPLAWTYLSYPFSDNNWLVILLALIFSIVLAIFSFFLEGKRDMGASFWPEKEGRARANKTLLSVPGLFFRLNRGLIIGCLLAYLILGAAYGSIYGELETFIKDNETMRQMFAYTGVKVEESFTSIIMLAMIMLVCILPIALVNMLFREEKNLRLNQIQATKVKRCQLYWTTIILAGTAASVGTALAALGLGGAALGVMEASTMTLASFFASAFNLLPSVFFFIGLGALCLGFFPRLAKALYIYLTYSFLLNYYGDVLDLPKWLINTSPQSWLAKVPLEAFKLNSFILVSLISMLMMLIGYYGYKKRDMLEES